jgi:HAMP domain-containing protein
MFVLATDAEGVAFITGAATVIAAVVLGGLAAWTADRRLGRQIADSGRRQERELAEAGRRQERELAADAERQQREEVARTEGQGRQLGHARELADLADLRALLDEAAVAIHEGAEAVHETLTRFSEHGRNLPSEYRDKVAERGRAIVSLLSRLQVRLGLNYPIVEHFGALSIAAWNAWRETTPLDADEPGETAKRFAALRTAGEEFDKAADLFVEAAVARFGTVTTKAGAAEDVAA